MNRLSSVRFRLVGIVFLAVLPALALLVYTRSEWAGFLIGLFALCAAWVGGELFILRQVNMLLDAIKRLASGNFTRPTGMAGNRSELGDLAREFDKLAVTLQRQIREREMTEHSLLNRAHQQTVIAALGQFALAAPDVSALLNQASLFITQTLEVEYCGIYELDPEGRNLVLRAGTGWRDGMVGNAMVPANNESQAGYSLHSGEPVVSDDLRHEQRFGIPDWLRECGGAASVSVAIQGQHQPFGVLSVETTMPRKFSEEETHFLLAITTVLAMAVERKRAEPEIQKLAAFARYNPNPVLEFSNEGNLTFFNDAALKMANALGEKHPVDVLPNDAPRIVQNCLATGQSNLDLETRFAGRTLSWSFYPIVASMVVHCYVEDITERSSLENQLRQAQKMESVGQLAAGVAHDFNNILTIIQGHSGLLMTRPNLTPAMTTSIQAVSFAAERAASLTRQLLMFSRKQIIQPSPLDLKEIVNNLSRMLQRLLGETVKLICLSAPQVPLIRGDAGMIEQILMNLAVNARDAMPRGGELMIQTDAVAVNEPYVRSRPEARVGNFVRLQVTDTGTGMDEATMRRIFEPFFTTKEAGKGTGLGLATVYGIVKQHSGWVEVGSVLEKGTTFTIYFPVSVRKGEEAGPEAVATPTTVRGGHETILVVEDEPVLRDLAQLILQDCGYRVLKAASGVDALTVWQTNKGDIDLLLTDMVMPDGLSGKDLADSLVANKPDLKVIFTSGYNVEDIGGDPSANNGSRFLQKPYSRATLAEAVRECLDA